MPLHPATRNTQLLLLDALETPYGLIVEPDDPRAFARRCVRLCGLENIPIAVRYRRDRPREIWLVKRQQQQQQNGEHS